MFLELLVGWGDNTMPIFNGRRFGPGQEERRRVELGQLAYRVRFHVVLRDRRMSPSLIWSRCLRGRLSKPHILAFACRSASLIGTSSR